MSASRFVVGIDLGTTNSALAYYDTGLGDAALLTHLTDSARRGYEAQSSPPRMSR